MVEPELPVLAFANADAFEAWLAVNHSASTGLWLQFFKKKSGVTSVVYAEALDVALCWGWIDSLMRPRDAVSYLQKFTPRRPRSRWSKINQDKVARLIKAKRMQPPGLRAIETAKANGQWARATDPPRLAQVPDDFLAALARNAKARKVFATLNKRNTFAIAMRVGGAVKPETRARRIKDLVAMLARGEMPYP